MLSLPEASIYFVLRTTEILYEWLKYVLSSKCAQNKGIGFKRRTSYALKKNVVLSLLSS